MSIFPFLWQERLRKLTHMNKSVGVEAVLLLRCHFMLKSLLIYMAKKQKKTLLHFLPSALNYIRASSSFVENRIWHHLFCRRICQSLHFDKVSIFPIALLSSTMEFFYTLRQCTTLVRGTLFMKWKKAMIKEEVFQGNPKSLAWKADSQAHSVWGKNTWGR